LPFDSVAASRHIASDVVEHIAGPTAAAWITLAMAISALGSMNSSVLSGARVGYAMARDGIFFKIADGIPPKFPHARTVADFSRACWQVLMALTGTFRRAHKSFYFCRLDLLCLRRRGPVSNAKNRTGFAAPLSLLGLSLGSGIFVAGALALTVNIWLERPAALPSACSNPGGTSFLSLVEHVRFSS